MLFGHTFLCALNSRTIEYRVKTADSGTESICLFSYIHSQSFEIQRLAFFIFKIKKEM